MAKTLKYSGSQDRWSEVAITGKQSIWRIGQTEERSDQEATALLSTGLFADLGAQARPYGSTGSANTIVLFGDSITYQNTIATATALNAQDTGAYNWCNAYLGDRFRLVKNAGVSGNTTAQMVARLANDVMAYPSDWVWIMGGINDVLTMIDGTGSVAQADACVATVTGNLLYIYETLLAVGRRPIAVLNTPAAAATQLANVYRRAALHRIITWIREYCARTPGMYLVDAHSAVLDPTSATGDPASGTMQDGLHPSSAGAQRMGRACANALQYVVPPRNVVASLSDRIAAYHYYGNVLPNGTMQGTSGTVSGVATGVVAANWECYANAGTVTAAKVARTDLSGYDWQQVTVSSAAYTSVTWEDNLDPTLVAGASTVYAAAEVDFYSLSGLNCTQLSLVLTAEQTWGTPVANAVSTSLALGNSGGNLQAGLGVMTLRTPDLLLPIGTTHLSLAVVAAYSGSGTAVYRVGRAELRHVGPTV